MMTKKTNATPKTLTGADLAGSCEGEQIADLIDLARLLRDGRPVDAARQLVLLGDKAEALLAEIEGRHADRYVYPFGRPAAEAPAPTAHIRKAVPRRGGNSFYRDKRDLTRYAATLCGEPVTDRDVTIRESAKACREGWPVCQTCIDIAQAQGGGR